MHPAIADHVTRCLNALRRRKQRAAVYWRRTVGRRLALARLRPLESDSLRSLPVFCISLPSDTRKRQFMRHQVDRLGFRAFSFLDAVDGRRLSPDVFAARGMYDDALARRYEGRGVSAANIALCQSHFRIWQTIADSGFSAALVLEDDAVFATEGLQRLDLAALPPEWDVASLDAYLHQKPPLGSIGGALYSLESYRGGTAGYVLSLSGARKMLAMAAVPVCHPIDGYMTWYNRHRLGESDPWRRMNLAPLHVVLVYPRPVLNGSLYGYWPSAIGGALPDY
jgi:GR25 family glycosyltransferase involved in LPS biosynthesis